MNTDPKPPHGYITATPFFFLLTPSFIERTGLYPIPEMHVATDLRFHGTVFEPGPDGVPIEVASSYLVKILGIEPPLLVSNLEMHPIDSHVPDGICKHPLGQNSFLAAAQLMCMARYPIHPN